MNNILFFLHELSNVKSPMETLRKKKVSFDASNIFQTSHS